MAKAVKTGRKSSGPGKVFIRPIKPATPKKTVWAVSREKYRKALGELEAVLAKLFEQAFPHISPVRRNLLIRREFTSDAHWIGFRTVINRDARIGAKGLTITPAQMTKAQTIADIAASLLAGAEKFPAPAKQSMKIAYGPSTNARFDLDVGGGSPAPAKRSIKKARPPLPRDVADSLEEPSENFTQSSGPPAGGDGAALEAMHADNGTTKAEPKAEPAARPTFFFQLEGGKAAEGNQALWGAEFDLIFKYGLLPELALAGVKAEQLDKLVGDNVHAVLGVDVVPVGLTLIAGGAGHVARFENGVMLDPAPSFRLRAPAKEDAEPAPRGVSVIFTVAGAMIYNFFLEILLVDEITKGPRATPVIDLDLPEVAAIKVDLPRVARLYCIIQVGSWQIYGNIDGVDLTPKNTTLVSPAGLNEAYRDGTLGEFTAIAGDAIWRNIDGNLEGDAGDKDAALASMKATVAAGSKLYQLLSADSVFKEALDLIEGLPDGSRITVYSDGTAFPWELLYPLPYVVDFPPENYQPEHFWGRRFIIESLLVSGKTVEKPPARARQPGNLRISMGLNSGIDREPPWNTPGRPLLPVQLQTDYFDKALKPKGGYFDQYDALFDTLRTAYISSLIYYFCHGSANKLKFDASKSVFGPMHVMGDSYPGWPVIFLNACDAADISPLSFFSFRTRFRGKKAAGLIAPSFPVPTLFAAVFAKAFLSAYREGEPVGEILFRLRRELLEKNNPLGLWYSLQCPLDVKAPEA